MNPTRAPGGTVSPPTDAAPPVDGEQVVDPPAPDQRATITETVATTVGGMIVGTAGLWFLAPICLTC